jgi:hypothetical protein
LGRLQPQGSAPGNAPLRPRPALILLGLRVFRWAGASQRRLIAFSTTLWFSRSNEDAEDGNPFTTLRSPSRSVGAPKLISRPAFPPLASRPRVSQPNSRYATGAGGAQPSCCRRILVRRTSSRLTERGSGPRMARVLRAPQVWGCRAGARVRSRTPASPLSFNGGHEDMSLIPGTSGAMSGCVGCEPSRLTLITRRVNIRP